MADLSATCDSIHLIIATSQTFSASQKDHAIGRINRSLVHINDSLKDVKEDLNCCLRRQSRDSLAADQEYSLASKQDNKYEFEILINTSVKTFKQSLRNLIHSDAKVKCLVLSTLEFNANGDLLFQDASFSLEDLLLTLNEEKKDDLKLVLLFNSRFVEANKYWKSGLEKSHKNVTTALVSDDGPASTEYDSFLNDLKAYLNEAPVESFMDVSKFTGTLRINRPCLYIFPGKEGDSAYFTINGYSMLINGGYDRLRPCFWRFVNMLQQIDSVLITHTDADALGGLGSFFAKKLASPDIKPNILNVLGNLIGSSTTKAAHTAANLIANEANHASGVRSDVDTILEAIEKLQLKLIPLVKSNEALLAAKSSATGSSKYEHVNLYSKLGHGSLDLYILSPFANSKEFKDFIQQQLTNVEKHMAHNKSHISYKNLFKTISLSHLNSAVVLAVWLPSYSSAATGTDNNALRLLFTGHAPQNVIFSALEKLKDFDVLQSATYKVKPNSAVTHTETLVQNLVAGIKKSATAATSKPAPAQHKEAPVGATMKRSPSGEISSKTAGTASHPKPVHTATKPVSSKPLDSVASNNAASKSSEKPPAAPKPAAKPAPASVAKEAPNKFVKNGHEPAAAHKAPVKPKEAKEGDDHKEETKKPVAKVAAKPVPAPAKPKEAAKANGNASETNGHAKESKPAQSVTANGVTKSTEKPKLAAKPAPKPAPKEATNAGVTSSAKKPTPGAKTEPAPAKKEKDEASRIITKRNVPKKSLEPTKVEETVATASVPDATPTDAVEEAVPVVVAEAPVVTESVPAVVETEQTTTNGHHEEIVNVVVKEEEAISVEPVPVADESMTAEVEPEVQDVEPVVAEVEQVEVAESEHNESVVQEQEQNESLVESTNEAEKVDEDQVSSSEVKAEVEATEEIVNDQLGELNGQIGNLKIETHDNHGSFEPQESPREEHLLDHHDGHVEPAVNDLNGNGIHTNNGFENGHHKSEDVSHKHNGNGNGLIDFDAPNGGDSFGKSKGVVENLINIEGDAGQSYEKTDDALVHHNIGYENDPAKWNLLELPKPVIPNDSVVSETNETPDSANTSLAEKKKDKSAGTASNGKKTSLAPEAKPATANKANTSITAPRAQAPSKPIKLTNIHPAYVEVTYIPAHGNSFYVDSEYFKRVRARFYILSTQDPSEALLNSIIEGKEAWEDKSLQMSLIPTYESESLRRWFMANEETLARLKIDILPAANLATLTMDDNPDLSFQLYKLEF